MVEKYVTVRNKLDSKVFNIYGQSVTLKSKSSPSYNDRGELDSETSTESTILMVPYNLFSNRQTYQKFGNLNEGDFDAAIRYDVTINVDDEIDFRGTDYRVKEINEEYLKEKVVTIIRLTKG